MQREPINFDDTATAFAYRSDDELRDSHLVFSTMKYPWVVKLGTALTSFALAARLPVRGLIKKTLFNQFCGGESIQDCSHTIDTLGRYHVTTILDYSVEGVESEEGYDQGKSEALQVMQYAKKSAHISFAVVKLSGLGSSELMTKVQEGKTLTESEKTSVEKLEKRVRDLIEVAVANDIMLMIDAEESWFQDYVDDLTLRMMQAFNKDAPRVFTTLQFYRHDTYTRLDQLLTQAKKEGFYVGVKLVRGAYMEKERERAEEKGYPSPIHETKESVDVDYDNGLRLCMENIDRMGICAGTHNEQSSELLAQLMEEKGLKKDDPRIFFAQLLGMSDNISFKLSSLRYNVAKYVPYGPVTKALPYLFRRAEENTSIAGQSGRQLTLVKTELKRRKQ